MKNKMQSRGKPPEMVKHGPALIIMMHPGSMAKGEPLKKPALKKTPKKKGK